MNDLNELQELKRELERKIAEAIEAESARQRAIEQERPRLQEAEIAKVKKDFQIVMSKYGLTPKDLLGRMAISSNSIPAKKAAVVRKPVRPGTLTEIRAFYTNNR